MSKTYSEIRQDYILSTSEEIQMLDRILSIQEMDTDSIEQSNGLLEYFNDKNVVGYPWWETWKERDISLQEQIDIAIEEYEKDKTDEKYQEYSNFLNEQQNLKRDIVEDVKKYIEEYRKVLQEKIRDSIDELRKNSQKRLTEIDEILQKKYSERDVALNSLKRNDERKAILEKNHGTESEEYGKVSKFIETYYKKINKLLKEINELTKEKESLILIEKELEIEDVIRKLNIEDKEKEVENEGKTGSTGTGKGKTGPTGTDKETDSIGPRNGTNSEQSSKRRTKPTGPSTEKTDYTGQSEGVNPIEPGNETNPIEPGNETNPIEPGNETNPAEPGQGETEPTEINITKVEIFSRISMYVEIKNIYLKKYENLIKDGFTAEDENVKEVLAIIEKSDNIIPELKSIIEKSDPKVDFISITSITVIIEKYKEQLKTLGVEDAEKISKLETSIKSHQTVIAQLQEELVHSDANESTNISQEIAGYEQDIEKWQKELDELGNKGINQKEIIRITQIISELQILIKYRQKQPFPEKPDPNLTIDEEKMKNEYIMRKHDMFAKYYGSKEREKEYKERLSRFKSHIIEVEDKENINSDGSKFLYKTVEEYQQMLEDIEFLQLEEYKERLERSTKYNAGDKSVYPKGELGDQLREEDNFYLSTFNSTYNVHKATQKSLQTMGNYGEKVPYLQMKKGQFLRNAARGLGNSLLFVRNHTIAPVNKFIGSKIVAPIHRKIYKPDKVNFSPYDSKTTHRFEQRKNAFREQGDGRLSAWFKSIFKAKDGNEDVLAAKGEDIQESIKYKYIQQAKEKYYQEFNIWYGKVIDYLEDEYKEADIQRKEEITKQIAEIKNKQRKLQEYLGTFEKAETIQTDAVDYNTRHATNKKNVTRTITGIKAATMLAARYIGPKINRLILDNTQKEELFSYNIPTQQTVVVGRKWIPGNYDPQKLQDLTIQDLMNVSKDTEGAFAVPGIRPKNMSSNMTNYIRGIAEDIDGRGVISFADGNKFDLTPFANAKTPQQFINSLGNIDPNTRIFDLIAELRNATQGVNTSGKEIIENLLSSSNPEQALKDLFERVNLSESIASEGIPSGWSSLAEEWSSLAPKIVKTGHWKNLTKVIDGFKTVQGSRLVDDPRIIKLLNGLGITARALGVGAGADAIYENARRTTSDAQKTNEGVDNFEFNVEEEELLSEEEKKTEGGFGKDFKDHWEKTEEQR